MHGSLPPLLYRPLGHSKPDDSVPPIGQYDPARATHTPLHDDVVAPSTPPHVPFGHNTQTDAPPTLEY